jgi:hypothetical protein
MSQITIEETSLSHKEMARLLTNATYRDSGLTIRIGRIGDVNISTRLKVLTQCEVTVSSDSSGKIVIEARGIHFVAGNDQLNEHFLKFISLAHCMTEKQPVQGTNYGNPDKVSFNQLRQ